jgi:anti-anti-sigma factor
MLEVHAKSLGNVAVLRLRGQFVNGETEILKQTLNFVSGVTTVVLDFERVTTVDARGLGVLLELREQAEAKRICVELTKVSRLVGNVLKLARLDTVFPIRSRVEYLASAPRQRRAPATVLASCA